MLDFAEVMGNFPENCLNLMQFPRYCSEGSDDLEWGGTIYSNGFFFVQTILTDRYIHRREF